MGSNVIVVNSDPLYSHVIQVEKGIAETKYIEEKVASKQFVLKAMADFVTEITKEIRNARAQNKLALKHFR